LIGIPNAGKSTLGRLAARKLRLPFYDTDVMLVERIKSNKLSDYLKMAFNGQFIFTQKRIMLELSHVRYPAIISTGAEVALIPECANLMKRMGTVIHIQRQLKYALAGLKVNENNTLIMERNGIKIDMQKEGMKLYLQEYGKYEKVADLTLENNGTEEEGLEKLLSLMTYIR
jgi:shikimate kinase